MKTPSALVFMLLVLGACHKKETRPEGKITLPSVTNGGKTITFASPGIPEGFTTEKLAAGVLSGDLSAPAKIAATVLASEAGDGQRILLFENPELAASYTQLMQHQINIRQLAQINVKQKEQELDRISDLKAHGAATGQDLLNAQTALSMERTNLANEKAASVEHESKLVAAGFSPELLQKASPGSAYLICEVPENQIGSVRKGASCKVLFTAFPDIPYPGTVDAVADMVDNVTRMAKVRIRIQNPGNRLKAGMFANVSLGISGRSGLTVSKNALVTVQGKNYVFVKNGAHSFERQEIQAGPQVGDRITVLQGLGEGAEIAIQGVIQLKGLSFGY